MDMKDIKKIGSSLYNAVEKAISVIIEKAKTAANNILDKISVVSADFTLPYIEKEAKEIFKNTAVSKVAVCDVKKLVDLHPEVSDWNSLLQMGVTHFIVSFDFSDNITHAYLYHDTSNYADKIASDYINRTDEGMVIISR